MQTLRLNSANRRSARSRLLAAGIGLVGALAAGAALAQQSSQPPAQSQSGQGGYTCSSKARAPATS